MTPRTKIYPAPAKPGDPPPVPDRFPPDVEAALRTAGWFPGRDAGALHADWIRRTHAEMAVKGIPGEVFPALEAALAEFGGLTVEPCRPGTTVAAFPFTIGGTSVWLDAADTEDLRDWLGELTLTVGVDEDRSTLLMGESGCVYLSHPVGGFFRHGACLDEALIKLVRGIRSPSLEDVPDTGAGAGHPLPTVGTLVFAGRSYSRRVIDRSRSPHLHPVLQELFDSLWPDQRVPHAGRCVEATLVSDRMWAMQEHWGDRRMDDFWVGEFFESAATTVTVTRTGRAGSPAHGTYEPPCTSCTVMLDYFRICAGPESPRSP
ncbi:SUKH-3 domain-containing protein [Streptomyces sp. NPDC050422]|uniref:SUKH-3 domain-containing protein n=1 Tax=Streptomyces sp. NPDC050422 TaxID=3365614 RepID=UPI0037B419B3